MRPAQAGRGARELQAVIAVRNRAGGDRQERLRAGRYGVDAEPRPGAGRQSGQRQRDRARKAGVLLDVDLVLGGTGRAGVHRDRVRVQIEPRGKGAVLANKREVLVGLVARAGDAVGVDVGRQDFDRDPGRRKRQVDRLGVVLRVRGAPGRGPAVRAENVAQVGASARSDLQVEVVVPGRGAAAETGPRGIGPDQHDPHGLGRVHRHHLAHPVLAALLEHARLIVVDGGAHGWRHERIQIQAAPALLVVGPVAHQRPVRVLIPRKIARGHHQRRLRQRRARIGRDARQAPVVLGEQRRRP